LIDDDALTVQVDFREKLVCRASKIGFYFNMCH